MTLSRLKLFIICLLIGTGCLYSQSKQKSIDAFVKNPILKNASIGICVKDMDGKVIASHNKKQARTPASILKVITTATGLEMFGSDFRYETTLSKSKMSRDWLIVRGSGDPTLGTKHFDNSPEAFLDVWGAEIKKAFPNSEEVGLTIVDDLFGYEGISQRWIRQDMGNYYAAGAYGISLFDNTYQLTFNTMKRDTCPQIVEMKPKSDLYGITFYNAMKLNTTGRDNGYIIGEPFSNYRILTGDIPAGKTSFSIKGDISNPGLFLAEKLSTASGKNGVLLFPIETARDYYLQNMYRKEKESFYGDVFYTHYSFPLKDIIQNINFRSNNHYAEHLIRAIGRKANPDIYSSALDEGTKKVAEYWQSKGLDTDALFMYDGCGLAPSNAVSPELMCDILLYMQNKSEYSDDFVKSIPLAGKEGTVRNLLKGTRLADKVRAKSGSIVNVRCYAGYYINGDKKYVFTVMVNNYNSPHNEVVKAIENLLLGIL